MKKILLALAFVATAFTVSAPAKAHGGWNRGFWTGAVVGGVVTYAATRPYYGPHYVYGAPYYGPYYPGYPYYAPPTVVIQQPPVYIQQPYPSNEYHQETILDANCNCYRTVWVHN